MGQGGARGGGGAGGVRMTTPEEQNAEANRIIGASQGVRASDAPIADRARMANALSQRISNDLRVNRPFHPGSWVQAQGQFRNASRQFRAGDVPGANQSLRSGETRMFTFVESKRVI